MPTRLVIIVGSGNHAREAFALKRVHPFGSRLPPREHHR